MPSASFSKIVHRLVPYFLLAVFAAVFVLISYVFINAGDLIHDYGFHLARLVGLAQSIENGDWLPNLTFVFEEGIGYALPMFYGCWQFYLPALFYLVVRNAPAAYAFFIFLVSCATLWSCYFCVCRFKKGKKSAVCFALACLFSYSWFGYGMTMATAFVPLLFYAMYRVLYLNECSPILLGVLIALLIQTHILSTLVLALACALFVLLNLYRLSWKKAGSFLASAVLGLILSSGYLFQYFEQIFSQTFFVNWALRDYPFALDQVVESFSVFELLSEPIRWIPFVCSVLLLVQWKHLSTFARQLLIIAGLLFLFQTPLLPWESLLRYTFLAVLQDTRRLFFFGPILIYLAAALSWKERYSRVLAGSLAVFYVLFCLIPFAPSQKTMAVLEEHDRRARLSMTNPLEDSFGAVGDEYFTIDVVHQAKSDGMFSLFHNPDGVRIYNPVRSYNSLEFDYELPDDKGSAGLLIPQIYYKGYQAEYSSGGSGSRPQMLSRPLSGQELEHNREIHKPDMTMHIEYSGQIYLQLNSSGHVRIFYEKTPVQKAGYRIEAAAWILVGLWQLALGRRIRNKRVKPASLQTHHKKESPAGSNPS